MALKVLHIRKSPLAVSTCEGCLLNRILLISGLLLLEEVQAYYIAKAVRMLTLLRLLGAWGSAGSR